ncbi:flagellar hook protein FlgE [Sphingomonas sp. SORGH_AS802]|jgi:flagellar hook protein FlgE|uniref:flagellar hook protein FlgE n=1 Tax=unclassified Sphingomonas TaxID=196159 RepID=UPI0028591080|nr:MULTISPECIES: flagellar hook protein FlgE [unclassified Sphingomonas]MDR6128289.1 flagellar hook protein FlgE [Sphingomonas sp. SORGH_AS_0438]MDR6135507.1 flagellar hook protein FlgE [Sphingomonas sp. SORGH_AS_0802]
MSFYTSLSGLQASQSEMSTISHNLANVATNGFKKSRTEFADVIASSVSLNPAQQVGSGTVVKANRQQFGQGNLIQSANSLDLAVSGDGFFVVKPEVGGAKVNFTRNGGFFVDSSRYVVDSQGGHLQVYPVDGSGAVVATGIDSATSLQLPATSGVAVPTKNVTMSLNLNANASIPTAKAFDRFDPSSYNQSAQTTIYDTAGNAMTLTNYFVRETTPQTANDGSTWKVYSFVGDKQLTSKGAEATTLSFNASGAITDPVTQIPYDEFTTAGATAPQQFGFQFGVDTTQLSQPFNVTDRGQDGKPVGQIQGVSIDETGLVKASFSNGDTQALGQVMLANFSNPEGLRQLGSSYWQSTGVSGEAKLGAAGANGFGNLMSGTIERSNVDITEELVNLIAAQRDFQANAKALDTASQISQTIFNIRT